MKIIVDKNITLYKARVKSADEIFECIDNSREFLREWLPWVDGTITAKDTEKYIKSLERPHGKYKDLVFEVRYKEAIAGLLGMKDIDSLNNKAEIGYWLGQQAVGKGIMIRSCRALINYAFTELHLNKIWIRCAVDNLNSCNIPKQLGFTYEGIERQGEFLHGRYIDIKIYSLLRKEWMKNNH